MIKLIKRIILLFIILVSTFIYVSVKYGGDGLRLIGETVQKGTADLGETADLIKESTEGITKTVTETADAIEKTSAKIKETSSKVSHTVKATSRAINQTTASLKKTSDQTVASLRQVGEAFNGPGTSSPSSEKTNPKTTQ